MTIRPLSIKTLLSLASPPSPYPLAILISHFSSSLNYPSHSSHFYSRRHDEESRNVRVSVWWDFENCNLPAGVNVFRVAHTITDAIRASGIKGSITITAFGDVLQLSRANQEALSSTGINLAHVPNGGKNSADRSLLVDLMYWVSQNPPPAHLFLISGDRDFASILHRLRMKNYNILLASPESAPTVLCSAASIMWHWHTLVKGENLTGKHFNQPPDGPYGSWYGHYKVPLEDPFSVFKQPACLQIEESSKPSSDFKTCPLTPVPKAVFRQIRQILSVYPKGISVTEFRSELSNSNVSIDKDLYGYKKFSRFLLSMPHILKLQPAGDGQFIVRGITQKAPEPFDSSTGSSTGPVYRNEDQERSMSSRLIGDDRSINGAVEGKTRSSPSPEPIVEEPPRKVQQTSPVNDKVVKSDMKKPPEIVQEPLLVSEKDIKVANAQVSKGQLAMVEQDSPYEVGIIKKAWIQWFGGNHGSSERNRHDVPEKSCKSGDNSERKCLNTMEECSVSSNSPEKEKVEGKCAKSHGQNADQVCPESSSSNHNEIAEDTKTSTEAAGDKAGKSPGFFNLILNWCKFWRSRSDADNQSDQSSGDLDHINSHSQKHEIFMKDSFWSDMESFMDSPRGPVVVSQSRTREQMAQILQKEGPLPLKSLSSADILHLVDLLISEKKWVKECPSQMSPFRSTRPVEKGSSFGRSRAANGLRSIFLGTQSQSNLQGEHDGEKKVQSISHSGVSGPIINKKPSDTSRSEILADCQKLVKQILKEYPEGYNMGSFRKLFLESSGYPLDIQKLGYQKLASLLQIMPGVRIESCYIIPSSMDLNDTGSETAFEENSGDHAVGNSDSELSGTSKRLDDLDSPWEELGPVSNTTSSRKELQSALRSRTTEEGKSKTLLHYELSLSDDEFSDSEGETSTVNQTEGQRKQGINEEDSSLLQILDSWYSSKEGDDKKKSEDVDGMVDCSRDVSKPSGLSGMGSKGETSLGSCGWKQRPKKSYSFVSDSVGDNKDKLIDGILGSLKKSSESKMQV